MLYIYNTFTLFVMMSFSFLHSMDNIQKSDNNESALAIVIERAFNVNLPKSDNQFSREANEYKQQAFKCIGLGDYEKALEILLVGLEKIPTNFLLQTYFATLIGDLSEKCSNPLKQKMIRKSKQLFNKLLSEIENQPVRDRYRFKNEYYYRFELYQEQYKNGQMMVAYYWGTKEWQTEDGLSGYYYQGAGATYFAKQLLLEGKKSLALEQAYKALVSWSQYFSYENDYYNAYVHYGLALGLIGEKQEMMKALQHGAGLIKKDLNYHEFRDVINFIEQIDK